MRQKNNTCVENINRTCGNRLEAKIIDKDGNLDERKAGIGDMYEVAHIYSPLMYMVSG